MAHSRNLIAAVGIVVAGTYIAWQHSSDDVASAAREIAELGLYDSRSASDFNRAISRATSGTRFSGTAILNPQLPGGGGLMVFLFDSANPLAHKARYLPPLRKNCASLAATQMIVCDVSTVDDLLARSSMPSDSPDQMAATRRAIVLWLVAHEVGHIIHGHSGAHQFQDGVEQGVDPRSVDHRQELEADEFASSVLFADPKANVVAVQALISLVNSEVRAKGMQPQYGAGILYDYNSLVQVTSRCSHPEMVVRAVRLLHIYGRQAGDLAIQAMLAPFIQTLRTSAATCGAAS